LDVTPGLWIACGIPLLADSVKGSYPLQADFREDTMGRERALKIVLVLVGLLFAALVYPMLVFVKLESALAMMMCLYATLGVFLLLAARNPAAHRSLIAFTAGRAWPMRCLWGRRRCSISYSAGSWWAWGCWR
jgi:hypothetical protein